MNLAQEILDTIFEDHKERKAKHITPFGGIIYTETNRDKSIVYSILQIYTPHDEWEEPNYYFEFIVYYIATSEEDFDLFMNDPEDARYELFNSIFYIETVRDKCEEMFGTLDKDDIYGFSDLYHHTDFNDDYLQKIPHNEYFEYVLKSIAYYTPNREDIFTTEYKCNPKDTKHIKSFYISPSILQSCQKVFQCKNLQSFTVSNNFASWEAKEISKLENLNYLNIEDTSGDFTDSTWGEEQLQAIAMLPYLVDISISGKSLQSTVFLNFSSLRSLKYLALHHANLSTIDTIISEMQNLEVLDLSNNNLSSLPKSLLQLKKLKILRLSSNPLGKIPEWIGDFKELEELDLSGTMLTTLPENIAHIPKLKKLKIRKNTFKMLPPSLAELKDEVVLLESMYRALYDNVLKKHLNTIPKEEAIFSNNFNLKLMVINKLMYEDEVLLPKFDIYKFVEEYDKRTIDIENEGYEIIPEVKTYFKNLKIPPILLSDITELYADGGDSIYSQLMPYWGGEEDIFNIFSTEEFHLLPQLDKFTPLGIENDVKEFLEKQSIDVSAL